MGDRGRLFDSRPGRRVVVGRDEDDRHGESLLELEAARPAHVNVEDQTVCSTDGEPFEELARGRESYGLVPGGQHDTKQRATNRGIVVDDRDDRGSAHAKRPPSTTLRARTPGRYWTLGHSIRNGQRSGVRDDHANGVGQPDQLGQGAGVHLVHHAGPKQPGVRAATALRDSALPTAKDHSRAAEAKCAEATAQNASGGTKSDDPQIAGMNAESAKDPAYQAAYRTCMRKAGFWWRECKVLECLVSANDHLPPRLQMAEQMAKELGFDNYDYDAEMQAIELERKTLPAFITRDVPETTGVPSS
jgi:hypothetical protein